MPSAVCSKICTSEPENSNNALNNTAQHSIGEGANQDTPLAKIAAALQAIPPADLANLAKLLDALAQHQRELK